jgi:hypothetical protein
MTPRAPWPGAFGVLFVGRLPWRGFAEVLTAQPLKVNGLLPMGERGLL